MAKPSTREIVLFTMDLVLYGVVIVMLISLVSCFTQSLVEHGRAMCLVVIDKHGEHVAEIPMYILLAAYTICKFIRRIATFIEQYTRPNA